jgi:hypothetical protein
MEDQESSLSDDNLLDASESSSFAAFFPRGADASATSRSYHKGSLDDTAFKEKDNPTLGDLH